MGGESLSRHEYKRIKYWKNFISLHAPYPYHNGIFKYKRINIFFKKGTKLMAFCFYSMKGNNLWKRFSRSFKLMLIFFLILPFLSVKRFKYFSGILSIFFIKGNFFTVETILTNYLSHHLMMQDQIRIFIFHIILILSLKFHPTDNTVHFLLWSPLGQI